MLCDLTTRIASAFPATGPYESILEVRVIYKVFAGSVTVFVVIRPEIIIVINFLFVCERSSKSANVLLDLSLAEGPSIYHINDNSDVRAHRTHLDAIGMLGPNFQSRRTLSRIECRFGIWLV